MNNKKLILGVAVILIVIVAVVLFSKGAGKKHGDGANNANQQVSTGEPMDIVFDFYDKWLTAAQSTTTDPYQSALTDEPLLSEELRTRLKAAQGNGEVDPVICQDPIPEKIVGKVLYEYTDKVQILIFSKEQDTAGQAIVTLLPLNDGWYINDILCSRGEFGEEREFSFDYSGQLLKSVPPPLDANYWHLVYVQDGTPGYAAQLFFDANSMCTSNDGVEAVCDTSQFKEAAHVSIKGQMSEYGVEVKKLEFLP